MEIYIRRLYGTCDEEKCFCYRIFCLVLFILTLSTAHGYLLVSVQDPISNKILLEPPNFSGKYRDNRPPFIASENLGGKQNVIEVINEIYPCNGSYLKTNGTTCGLKEIMIGRCYEYQYVKRGLYLSNRT